MRFLVIQTAFLGDVILATSVSETLKNYYPEAIIDFVVRKGNESLLLNNPTLNKVFAWDKKSNKISNLFKLIHEIRKNKYDAVFNLHRFASSGIITISSNATYKAGFKKNPLSLFFTKSYPHAIGDGTHEIARNARVISKFVTDSPLLPRLYPSATDYKHIEEFVYDNDRSKKKYICIAPASVWFTKQYPVEKWIELIDQIPSDLTVYLLGAPTDKNICGEIMNGTRNKGVNDLSGKLSLLQSAALIASAKMNYVNDSGPLHMASAMNAPVTAIFCSTVPEFGFGPLSTRSKIVQTTIKLSCKPCGIHGYRKCPLGHFKCALTITKEQLLNNLNERRD